MRIVTSAELISTANCFNSNYYPSLSTHVTCSTCVFFISWQYVAFASSTMLVGVDSTSIWSFRQFHLRFLSIPVCLSKDVTGALVGSRGHNSPSFIVVRFIVLSIPGPYLFISRKQLIATLICSWWECQLRRNRPGSMVFLCTVVSNVLSSRELRSY